MAAIPGAVIGVCAVVAVGTGAAALVPVAMSTFGVIVPGVGTMHAAGGVAATLQVAASTLLSGTAVTSGGAIGGAIGALWGAMSASAAPAAAAATASSVSVGAVSAAATAGAVAGVVAGWCGRGATVKNSSSTDDNQTTGGDFNDANKKDE